MEKYNVKLTEDERKELLSLLKKGKNAAATLLHARILLAADNNKKDREIEAELFVSLKTIQRVRQRYVEEGLEFALHRKAASRPPRPRKLNGEQEAKLVSICCSKAPEGYARWTLKLLANELVALEIVDEISPATVGRVLKKMN